MFEWKIKGKRNSENNKFFLFQQIDEMREHAHRLVLDDEPPPLKERSVKSVSCDIDKGYFNTYSHFAIHHEMLTVLFLFYKLILFFLYLFINFASRVTN